MGSGSFPRRGRLEDMGDTVYPSWESPSIGRYPRGSGHSSGTTYAQPNFQRNILLQKQTYYINVWNLVKELLGHKHGIQTVYSCFCWIQN